MAALLLTAGRELLHYRLVEEIGAGAMGVVWRATDTTLERQVALKFLPDGSAGGHERLRRFEREARLLAAVDHPNIAGVYGLHEVDGERFIAMELVEGETLAERIDREGGRGLPLDEVLRIFQQIADALEAAHDRGIIHRDLKPANVKLRPDGTVKVLDFGLARALVEEPAEVSSQSPTEQRTRLGTVLGTAPYMSPEQARGQPVDKRADIWALGCVLFECLSGGRAFTGATHTDVLAAVIGREPDLEVLPRSTPPFLRALLLRCLDKDVRSRLRDAGELRVAIEAYRREPTATGSTASHEPRGRRSSSAWPVPWALAAVLAIGLAASLWRADEPRVRQSTSVSAWEIALPPGFRVGMPVAAGGRFDYSRLLAISPDGSRLVFAVQDENGQVELYLRRIDATEPQRISGTTNARAPFFSPDGRWLGFFADNAIRKVALTGGSPQKVCDVGRLISFDASWSPDGRTIVFATDRGLWRVAADGGTAEQLTEPDAERGEVGHHAPQLTPDGRAVLFTVTVTPEMHLARLDLDSGEWEILVRNASQGALLGHDRIVFARRGELVAARYDPRGHRLLESPVTVLQNVDTSPGLGGMVLTQYVVSDTGTLAYVPATGTRADDQLLWVDPGGETPITSGAGTWVHPRLSPDGRRISVDIHSPDGMRDVYIYELFRGQLNRLTESGITWESEWRPDGRRIATLSGAPAGYWSLFWVATDFSGPPELLHRADHAIPLNWLPDGRSLLFAEHRHDGGIWRLWPEDGREPRLVMGTSARERFGRLSPDGNWIAYVADETERGEVFVQSFPELGPRTKVSIGGGLEPLWSRRGDRLFFRRQNEMLSVRVSYEPTFSVTLPELLFTGEYDGAPIGHQHYDVSLDDGRLLMIRHGEVAGPNELRVVLGWSAGLDAMVQADGAG